MEPPKIHIENIKDFHIQIIVGKEDELATVEDARWLQETLGSDTVEQYMVMNFGH